MYRPLLKPDAHIMVTMREVGEGGFAVSWFILAGPATTLTLTLGVITVPGVGACMAAIAAGSAALGASYM